MRKLSTMISLLSTLMLKKNDFPVMHPTAYVGDECEDIEITSVFGLIKCSILPPADLHMVFSLCAKCAVDKESVCEHDPGERTFHGTWTSAEIHKALELDYLILKVYEIYDYEQRDKIFGLYADTFFKLKQESSGIPKKCLNENGEVNKEALEYFAKMYEQHEGVKLDVNAIMNNPGKRTVMKQLLNTLWGKLAQNESACVVSFIDDFHDLIELVKIPVLR